MTNQSFDHDPSGRECALAGRDASDPSACKACVAQMTSEPTEQELSDGLDAIVAAANARARARIAARAVAAPTFTKAMLAERKRGKGGSIVTVRAGSWSARFGVGPFVVKDLMERKNFTDPLQIGVGPLDRGVAWGVLLADIVNVRVAQA